MINVPPAGACRPACDASTSLDSPVMATQLRQPAPDFSVVDVEATESFMGGGSYVLFSLGALAVLGTFVWPLVASRAAIARWETWPLLL